MALEAQATSAEAVEIQTRALADELLRDRAAPWRDTDVEKTTE